MINEYCVEVSGDRTTVHSVHPISYSIIHPKRAVFDPNEDSLRDIVGNRPVLFVSDSKVAALYGSRWRTYARDLLTFGGEILLEQGENAKSWAQVERICEAAVAMGLPRHGVIVGIGGGIVLDTAGFAASILRRGVDYVRIPTTLVGLVDVAVGIKQGVNAFGKKNLLGSFYPPLASINDYRFVRTLEEREVACGFAEILKMALLRDADLLRLLEQHGARLLATRFAEPAHAAFAVVHRAELLMMEELAPNLLEDNLARLVDFGHTFSPVIETSSGFEIPHGHAVAIDMFLSLALSCPQILPRVSALYKDLALPCWDERVPGTEALLAALDDVRRHRGGALNLVSLQGVANPFFLQDVPPRSLLEALTLAQRCARKNLNIPGHFIASETNTSYERPAL